MFDSLHVVLAIVALVLAAVAGVAVAKLLWKIEDALVAERKKAAALGSLLSKYGHTIAANVLQSIAVGDLVDAFEECEDVLDDLQDPTKGPVMLQTDLVSQLNAQLAMPGAAAAILTPVAAFAAANPAAAAAAGLAAKAISIVA
jgi:hypothetical protein